MKLTDIIDLAKAGYKPQDVKDLIALAEPETKEPEKDPLPEAEKEPEQPEEKHQEKEEPDYKTLYEEAQKKLKNAQQNNRNESGHIETKTDEEKALDFVNGLFS